MSKWKQTLLCVAVLAALGVIGTAFNPDPASAQNPVPGSAPVNIVGPLPLPVTGSTTVSGSIAATQSGPWNVVTRNLDEPGRSPYQTRIFGDDPVLLPQVPAGKRLVIQDVSFNASFISDPPTTVYGALSLVAAGRPDRFYAFPLTSVGADVFLGNFPVTAYIVDPTDTVQLLTNTNFSIHHAIGATVSGYLIDCSAAYPCAAQAP